MWLRALILYLCVGQLSGELSFFAFLIGVV